ncbi:unnamed protein product [Camellia sinensis]
MRLILCPKTQTKNYSNTSKPIHSSLNFFSIFTSKQKHRNGKFWQLCNSYPYCHGNGNVVLCIGRHGSDHCSVTSDGCRCRLCVAGLRDIDLFFSVVLSCCCFLALILFLDKLFYCRWVHHCFLQRVCFVVMEMIFFMIVLVMIFCHDS